MKLDNPSAGNKKPLDTPVSSTTGLKFLGYDSTALGLAAEVYTREKMSIGSVLNVICRQFQFVLKARCFQGRYTTKCPDLHL